MVSLIPCGLKPPTNAVFMRLCGPQAPCRSPEKAALLDGVASSNACWQRLATTYRYAQNKISHLDPVSMHSAYPRGANRVPECIGLACWLSYRDPQAPQGPQGPCGLSLRAPHRGRRTLPPLRPPADPCACPWVKPTTMTPAQRPLRKPAQRCVSCQPFQPIPLVVFTMPKGW